MNWDLECEIFKINLTTAGEIYQVSKSLNFSASFFDCVTRCFYLAQSYSQAKKWTEAAALFERAVSHAESSKKEWKAIKSRPVKVKIEKNHSTFSTWTK